MACQYCIHSPAVILKMHLGVIAEKYTDIRLVSELQGVQIHGSEVITRRLYSAVSLGTGKPISVMEYDVAELSLEARGRLVMSLDKLSDISIRLSETPGSCLALHGSVVSYGREGFIYQELQHGRSLTDEILHRRCTGTSFSESEVWEILNGVVTAIESLRRLEALSEPIFFTTDNVLLQNDSLEHPLSVLVRDYMDAQICSLPDILLNYKQYCFSLPFWSPSSVADRTLPPSLNEGLVWNIGTLLLKVMIMKPSASLLYEADNTTNLQTLLSGKGFSSQLICMVLKCLESDSKKRESLERVSSLAHLKVTAHLAVPIQPYEYIEGDTDLMRAAASNDIDSIHSYIHLAKSRNKYGRTALMLAAERGHLEAVKLLASHELQMKDEKGMTALMYAAIAGRDKVASYLIVTGVQLRSAETGIFSTDNHCALMYAIIHNRAECIRLLAPEETNARVPETGGETVLMWAIHKKEESFLADLADAAANCEPSSSESGQTALMLAAITGFTTAINLLLFQTKMSDTHGRTALMYAVLESNTAAAELLAPHECKQHDERGEMAIIKAMRAEDIDMVKLLIPYEGKGHTADGLTPLMVAAKTANRRIFDLLMNETLMAVASDGTNILDYLSRTGNATYRKAVLAHAQTHGVPLTLSPRKPTCIVEHKTRLMEAVEQNDPDLVAQCIDQAGCLLLGFVSQGCGTALMMAINNRHIDCASLLVEREAGIQTKEGLTALMRAAEMDYTAGVKLLSEHETLLQDWNGWCALMWAASKNNVSSVRLLLSEQSLRNNAGKNALQVAQVSEQEAAVSILNGSRK